MPPEGTGTQPFRLPLRKDFRHAKKESPKAKPAKALRLRRLHDFPFCISIAFMASLKPPDSTALDLNSAAYRQGSTGLHTSRALFKKQKPRKGGKKRIPFSDHSTSSA